jgi:hypothetical protein
VLIEDRPPPPDLGVVGCELRRHAADGNSGARVGDVLGAPNRSHVGDVKVAREA